MANDDQIAFDVYGDESIVGNAIVYGAVVVPTLRHEFAEHFLEALKLSYGGQTKDRIHCKKLFHPAARAKTAWAHLDESRVQALLAEFARGIASLCARPSVGYVDKSRMPETIEGLEGRSLKLDEKSLTVFAFGGAIIPIINDVGRDRLRVWVDPDRTKIDWWGQRRQVLTALGFFTDLGKGKGEAEQSRFGPEPQRAEKPSLIDAADLLAYTAAQVLSAQERGRRPFFQSLWKILDPVKQEFHLASDAS